MSPHQVDALGYTIALAVVKTLLLVVGSVITYFAFKAYRRTRHPALGYLSVGFGLATVGIAIAGMVYEVLGGELVVGILIESVLVLVGFVVIAYSLYVQ